MNSILWVIVGLAGILLFLRQFKKLSFGKIRTSNVPISRIDQHIRSYMRRGNEGSVIAIECPRTNKFVQFVKNLDPKGRIDLEFGFPNAEWSREYFDNLKTTLERENIEYHVTETDTRQVPEFVDVSCHSDVSKAVWVARIALIEIMGMDENGLVDVCFQGGGDPRPDAVIGKLWRKEENHRA